VFDVTLFDNLSRTGQAIFLCAAGVVTARLTGVFVAAVFGALQ
jgi:hypothetical protein